MLWGSKWLGQASVSMLCRTVVSFQFTLRSYDRELAALSRASYEFIRRSSSSSKRWQTRAGNDKFSKEARVQGLKSRAAFKLLEINEKYKLFKKGQTVVDLGYAPGSWSQVAADRTSPGGRVIGIDIIPAQPPKGVSTFQGNFLSEEVQNKVKEFLRNPQRGRLREHRSLSTDGSEQDTSDNGLEVASTSYFELEREASSSESDVKDLYELGGRQTKAQKEMAEGRMVDLVLSDMMMNTSGMNFRDHVGSMDLCNAALRFGYDTLRTGGHFVCKFYQGAEDKALEKRLKALFAKVHREKPESSRSESKEAYFVALRRKGDVPSEMIFNDL